MKIHFIALFTLLLSVSNSHAYSEPLLWKFSTKDIVPDKGVFVKGRISESGILQVYKDEKFEKSVKCTFPRPTTGPSSSKKINFNLDCGVEIFALTQYDLSPMEAYFIGIGELAGKGFKILGKNKSHFWLPIKGFQKLPFPDYVFQSNLQWNPEDEVRPRFKNQPKDEEKEIDFFCSTKTDAGDHVIFYEKKMFGDYIKVSCLENISFGNNLCATPYLIKQCEDGLKAGNPENVWPVCTRSVLESYKKRPLCKPYYMRWKSKSGRVYVVPGDDLAE